MVEIASVSGSTNSSSRISTIASTARLRRRHSRAWIQSKAGQVATTTIAAQIVAPRKGRRIQSEEPMSNTRVRTPKVVLARSGRGSDMAEEAAGCNAPQCACCAAVVGPDALRV